MSRHSITRRIRTAFRVVALVTLAGFAGVAHAAIEPGSGAAAPKLPEPPTREGVRELVARLSDAEVRGLLLAQLDRVVESPRPRAEGLSDVVQETEERLAQIRLRAGELVEGGAALPAVIGEVRGRFLEGRRPGHLALVAAWLVVMFGGGLVAERVVRYFLRGLRSALETDPGEGLGTQTARLALRLALDLLGLLTFVVGSVLLFLAVYQGHLPTRRLALTTVAAVVIVRLVALVSRLLLAPDRPALRLLPLGDAAASTLHRGVVRLSALYALGLAAATLLRHYDAPRASVDALNAGLATLFLGLAVDIVWRLRGDVGALIRGSGNPGPLRRLLAGSWAVLVTAYLALVYLTRILELLSEGPSISKAPILSVVLLVLLPVVDLAVCRVATTRFRRAREGAEVETPPDDTTFEPVVRRAIHLAVVVVGLVAFVGLWDIDLFALAESRLGGRLSGALLGITITVLLAWTLWDLVKTAIDRRLAHEATPASSAAAGHGQRSPTRLRTLLPLLRMFLLAAILVMATLSILAALGVNILPLLAGASVFGLAIGFGSQTLVRDIVSGAFFLVEDAFRLGEYIEAGDAKGTVEKITIRSLHLRHHRGAINVLPYGEIKQLRNTSRDWMILTMEFRLTYDTDLTQVRRIVKRVGAELAADPEMGPAMLAPLKSAGVSAAEDSALVVRVKFTAHPGHEASWTIRREAYARLLKAFMDAGIRFAHRQVTVHVDSGDRKSAAAGAAAEAVTSGTR